MGFLHYPSKGFFRVMPMAAALMFVMVAFFSPVASGDTSEGELYQDEKGEWKIKYLNRVPQSETQTSFSDAQTREFSDQTTEVELYQDKNGEWKVRYITPGEQAPTPELSGSQSVTDHKDKIVAEDVVVTKVKLDNSPLQEPVPVQEEPTFETVDDEQDDQFKEMTSELTSESVEVTSDIPEVVPDVIKDVKPVPKKTVVSQAFEKDSPAVYSNIDDDSGRNPNHQWELGFGYSFYEFEQKEYLDNLGNTVGKTNQGHMAGIHFGYEHIMADHGPYRSLAELINNIDDVSRYKFTLDYRTGQTEYDDISGSPKEGFTQHILEAKAVAGYDFMLKGNTRLTPFMGFGYRYLNDSSGGVLDIPLGSLIFVPDSSIFFPVFSDLRQPYTLESHYFYLPVGFSIHNDILHDLSVGVNFEFDYVFLGFHRSSFNDLGVLYFEPGGENRTQKLRDTTNRLRGGIGLKGSTRVTKKNKMFDWFVEPYIRYWHINQSKKEQFPFIISDGQEAILFQSDGVTAYNHIEPENSTTEYGLQIGFVY